MTTQNGETQTKNSDEAANDLAVELDAARAKAQEHWDAYLRVSADLENLRRRSERELEKAHKYGLEKFAAELLAVKDSLEMGLQAATDDADVVSVREGMALTQKMLDQTLERFGIVVIDPAGEPFDPELHEAMTTQTSEQAVPNTVLTVVQKGYRIHDRLLRPAMVIVAREPRPE